MPQREGNHIVESTTEARAAVTGQHMRYVLTISSIACAVLFVGVYIYFFA